MPLKLKMCVQPVLYIARKLKLHNPNIIVCSLLYHFQILQTIANPIEARPSFIYTGFELKR